MDQPNHTIFPVRLIEETIAILKEKQAHFALPRDLPASLRGAQTRLEYLREYATWRDGVKGALPFGLWLVRRLISRRLPRTLGRYVKHGYPAGTPHVFLQHDADRNPSQTIRVLESENLLGVRSAAYFFRERAPRWIGDHESYVLPIEQMQEFERLGFEIGYHLNAPELVNYEPIAARRRLSEDVEFFKSNFRLTSFVPHGGRYGANGENNHLINHDGPIADLLWFYNGRGPITDITWSDGVVEAPESRTLEDPRAVAKRVDGRMRVRFLFHPQYYGHTLRSNLEGVGVTHTAWWRSLWSNQ
jgi:hypothetical protein